MIASFPLYFFPYVHKWPLSFSYQIKYLDNPGLEVAKRILKEIDERKMPKFVKKVFLSLDGTVKNYSEVEKEIETGLAEYCEGLKIYVKVFFSNIF